MQQLAAQIVQQVVAQIPWGVECRPHGQDRRQPRPSMVLREIHGELEELNAEASMLATTIKMSSRRWGYEAMNADWEILSLSGPIERGNRQLLVVV